MCNLAALECILFELWSIKVTHFLTILCAALWAPQPPAPPVHTCIFLNPNDLGLFFFISKKRYQQQIDTKVNALGLVEVLKNVKHMRKRWTMKQLYHIWGTSSQHATICWRQLKSTTVNWHLLKTLWVSYSWPLLSVEDCGWPNLAFSICWRQLQFSTGSCYLLEWDWVLYLLASAIYWR